MILNDSLKNELIQKYSIFHINVCDLFIPLPVRVLDVNRCSVTGTEPRGTHHVVLE